MLTITILKFLPPLLFCSSGIYVSYATFNTLFLTFGVAYSPVSAILASKIVDLKVLALYHAIHV